jgi:nitrogenase-associated protein
MSHLVFFEKPGCGGNARQRATLEAAGHTLERRNLLTAHWTAEALLEFLAPLPVPQWFNRAAPCIKSGEVVPEALDAEAALALLIAEPLLIRRPLMLNAENGSRHVGFDTAAVTAWIGLVPSAQRPGSLEGCSSPTTSCSTPTGGQHAHV